MNNTARSMNFMPANNQILIGLVVRKNGKVFRKRACPECGVNHWHGDNMCVACRNAEQQRRHGPWYVKHEDSQAEIHKQKRIATLTKRISCEIRAIETAGLSAEHSTIGEIMDAGIELENAHITTGGYFYE